jgi:arylsulfatase A-like enzyme
MDLRENTIVIFTSDNGSRNDFGESNGPLRGSKATTWEGGQRVPFIINWPGHIEPGVSDALLSSLELYPSLARIGGATLPADRVIDGLDATDLLLGRTEQSPRETFFYYMCNNLEAVRQGPWKLHVSRRPAAGKPSRTHDGTASSKPVIDQNEAVTSSTIWMTTLARPPCLRSASRYRGPPDGRSGSLPPGSGRRIH